jgi:hypothetical protein
MTLPHTLSCMFTSCLPLVEVTFHDLKKKILVIMEGQCLSNYDLLEFHECFIITCLATFEVQNS